MSEKPRVIRFKKPVQKYISGEIAGFPKNIAAKYVSLGVAEYVDLEAVKKAEEVVKKEPENLVTVKFLTNTTKYAEGEIAKFPEKEALQMAKKKIVKIVTQSDKPSAKSSGVRAKAVSKK